MVVERIYICPDPGGLQIECQYVSVVEGAGIVGDRYFGCQDEPGRNITLIEVVEVEEFIRVHQRSDDLSITHRNILTRGVRLNELVGVEFLVGDVKLRGVELCEPCLGMGQALSSDALPPAAVVKHFVRRGGLRATLLSSGAIEIGAKIARTAA